MQVKEIQITIKVHADTVVRLAKKEALLKSFSDLPAHEQDILTQIMNNPKALKGLVDNWEALKKMI